MGMLQILSAWDCKEACTRMHAAGRLRTSGWEGTCAEGICSWRTPDSGADSRRRRRRRQRIPPRGQSVRRRDQADTSFPPFSAAQRRHHCPCMELHAWSISTKAPELRTPLYARGTSCLFGVQAEPAWVHSVHAADSSHCTFPSASGEKRWTRTRVIIVQLGIQERFAHDILLRTQFGIFAVEISEGSCRLSREEQRGSV